MRQIHLYIIIMFGKIGVFLSKILNFYLYDITFTFSRSPGKKLKNFHSTFPSIIHNVYMYLRPNCTYIKGISYV